EPLESGVDDSDVRMQIGQRDRGVEAFLGDEGMEFDVDDNEIPFVAECTSELGAVHLDDPYVPVRQQVVRSLLPEGHHAVLALHESMRSLVECADSGWPSGTLQRCVRVQAMHR